MTKRNKRQSSRKRRHRHTRLLRIAAILLIIPILAASGIFTYLYTHPVRLKDTVIRHELMTPFDPWENVKDLYFAGKKDVNIQTKADVEKIGEYPVTYTCRGHEYKATVKVEDTTPPILKVQSYTTDLAEEITPEKFVQEVSDFTETSVRFKDPQAWDKEGTYDIQIAATDTSGNETVETATLTRKKDSTPPVVQGADNVEVLQGRTIDFSEGVTVTDDMDPDPKFSVNSEQVDFATPGTYEVIYTTKDRSGNEGTTVRQITVKKDRDYDRKVVYLTFDDGPSAHTDKILEILNEYNAKATFFVTGNNQKHNDVLKRIVDQGSVVALHTYTHNYAEVYASEEAYFKDLQKISDMVKEATGVESKLIRFPGGSSNTVSKQYCPGLMTKLTKAVQEKGYQYFDWNCDSTDASGNNVPVKTLVENATSSSARHINILMHDTDAKGTTVEALPDIIKHYRSQGYAFEALTVDSYPAHHSVNN